MAEELECGGGGRGGGRGGGGDAGEEEEEDEEEYEYEEGLGYIACRIISHRAVLYHHARSSSPKDGTDGNRLSSADDAAPKRGRRGSNPAYTSTLLPRFECGQGRQRQARAYEQAVCLSVRVLLRTVLLRSRFGQNLRRREQAHARKTCGDNHRALRRSQQKSPQVVPAHVICHRIRNQSRGPHRRRVSFFIPLALLPPRLAIARRTPPSGRGTL